jgi:hypothetical protein
VAGATYYYMYVSDSGAAGKIAQWYTATQAGCASGTGTCSVTPSTTLAAGSAQWWIQTWNSCLGGSYGPWSDPKAFTVPGGGCTSPPAAATLVSPSGTVSYITPTYTWNAVACATYYQLYVSDSSASGKIAQWYTASEAGCAAGTGTCSVTPGTALAAGSAQWWIQTYGVAGNGPWSSGMAFTIQITAAQTSFVLTWGANPRDLDSHLLTPSIGGTTYHVYYSNKGSSTSPPYARLDVDDTDGYGPETLTIYQLYAGTYHYYVYRFAGTGTIAGSGAQVKIYNPQGLAYTVTAPSSGTGDYWRVADVNGSNGQITIINQITTTAPSAPGLEGDNLPPKELSPPPNADAPVDLWAPRPRELGIPPKGSL